MARTVERVGKTRSEIEILDEVIKLAVEYYTLTGKPLGVTGEVAEFLAASTLNLELAPPRSAGYDAIRKVGRKHEKIQIKGRYKKDGKKWGRMSKINKSHDFDTVLLVLMHRNYELVEIWEADRETVLERLTRPGSKSRNERSSMAVSQFKSIARQVWPA